MNTQSEKQRAKQIIVELVRQAGGSFENKTNLYKAFYHAHLQFARTQPGFLSLWPIVRMPRGPGIDNSERLFAELIVEDVLEAISVQKGAYESRRFVLADKSDAYPTMTPEELEAIRYGLEQVKNKTASRVSVDSHAMSRSWRQARDGQELNIYLDLPSDEEYDRLKAGVDKLAKGLESVWG